MPKNFFTKADFTSSNAPGPAPAPDEDAGTDPTIAEPVGDHRVARCRNLADDVRAIQTALNRFEPRDGGPSPKLDVTAAINTRTEKAIWNFQQKWGIVPKGWAWPDGIVDRDGKTIKRLRKGPPSDPSGVPLSRQVLPRVVDIANLVLISLLAAEVNRTLPEGPVKSLDFEGGAALARVDLHFKSGLGGEAGRSIATIARVFSDMSRIATRALAPDSKLIVDEPDKSLGGFIAFTQGGGMHIHAARSPDDYIQMQTGQWLFAGAIYLCPRFRALQPHQRAYALVHEMAHFVGPRSEPIIDDHGYFHKGTIAHLTHHQCLHNADSYAQFAFDTIGMPSFNVETS